MAVLHSFSIIFSQELVKYVIFAFKTLLRVEKNSLPPIAAKKISSWGSHDHSYANCKIWCSTFNHFGSYVRWKKIAMPEDLLLVDNSRRFHRQAPWKIRTRSSWTRRYWGKKIRDRERNKEIKGTILTNEKGGFWLDFRQFTNQRAENALSHSEEW